jgi:hypothetical protein
MLDWTTVGLMGIQIWDSSSLDSSSSYGEFQMFQEVRDYASVASPDV